jgi:hypothetical protein
LIPVHWLLVYYLFDIATRLAAIPGYFVAAPCRAVTVTAGPAAVTTGAGDIPVLFGVCRAGSATRMGRPAFGLAGPQSGV